jgi:peptidoglycan/LPS O-acetylase OafA/YrhL
MAKTTGPRKVYYPALDGLRLFAMLGVLAYHYAPAHCPGGFLGVDVFLVISGFLLTRSLLAPHPEGFGRWYARYLLRRVLRLGLPMLVMFLLAVSVINAFYSDLLYNVRGALISSLLYVNNWWQIAQGSSYFQSYVHPSAFTHLWYIAVLMQICLVWPLVVTLVLRLTGRREMVSYVSAGLAILSALIMALVYHADTDPSRIYYGTDTRFYAFALGGALAALPVMASGRRRRSSLPPAALEAGSFLLLLALLFMSMHLFDQSKWTYRGGLFLSALLAAILVGLLARPSAVARILGARPLALAGKCTYSCYLWYYPVMTMGNATPFLAKNAWLQWIILAALSVLTYVFVEEWLTKSLMRGRLPKAEALRSLPGRIRTSLPALIAALVCLALTVSSVVGLVRAPSGDNQTVAEMEAQIAENQRILAEQQAQRDRDDLASSGSVDWLAPSIQLFCRNSSVSFVGDSILLAAAKPLSQLFPQAVIDGKVGRQLNQSVDIINSLRDQGTLGDIVVVVLGSNGSFTDEQFKTFMEAISDKTVFLVNTSEPRPWQEEVNKKLAACADGDEEDNIYLIDWKTLIDQHPEWLYEDMTHTNEEGAQQFAALIATDMYNTLVDQDQREKDAKADAAAKEKTASAESADQSADSDASTSDSQE